MVAAGTIRPKYAIVADPDLGFPPGYRDFIEGLDTLDPASASAVQRAVAALSEEDHSFLSDTDLDAFLDAASTLGSRYRDMLDALEAAGTVIFKWGSSDPTELQPIYQELAGTGFDIIGPSVPQDEISRDQIIAYARDVRDELIGMVDASRADNQAATVSAVELYRAAGRQDSLNDQLSDRKGQGSAINCQSIVLKFGAGDQKVLLAADMQFTNSEVSRLGAQMKDLTDKVIAEGPYKLVKTTHHTSYNGIDAELWKSSANLPCLFTLVASTTKSIRNQGLWTSPEPQPADRFRPHGSQWPDRD